MRLKVLSKLTLLLILIYYSTAVMAQTDEPLVAGINYGMSVQETLTDHAFFDWWQLEVAIGDNIVVSMQAAEGLQPLLGLLDADGTLMTRSDLEAVADVDGVAFMRHEAVTAGLYTIIASRDGRDVGTTTGTYLLTVTNQRADAQSRPDPFLETEFRCDEWLLTNALTFQFSEDVTMPENVAPAQITEFYRISVFGLDGFEPVIRIQSDILMDRPLDCTDSSQATEGSQLEFPFLDESYIITEDDADNVAMVTITNSGDGEPLGEMTINIGAKSDSSGRYIVVLEGMELDERRDDDEFFVRRGAFASDSILDVYMIGHSDNRLDSQLGLLDDSSNLDLLCDDLGRGDCSDLPAIESSTILIGEDGATYAADRFDAGLRMDTPENAVAKLIFQSREHATFGKYVVVFVGELPAR